MKRCLSLLILVGSSAALLAPGAFGDTLDRLTRVTFAGPVEIPGMVLPAGKYVMKLLDPIATHNVVQFYNPDESHMYAMVFANPIYRTRVVDHTVINFEERAGDAPPAIKDWYFPDANWGEEFVYGKARPVTVAENTPAPAAPAQAAQAPAPPAAAPQATIQPVQPVQQAPVEVAQAQPAPTPPATTAAPAAPAKELPKTASDLPLTAMLGGILLAAGAGLRRKPAHVRNS